MREIQDLPRKTVLITGASSGIGQQLALDYLHEGWRVIGCGRNAERLTQLTGIEPLLFDITDRDQVLQAAKTLPLESLDLIILNAGDCEYIDNPLEFDDQLFAQIMHTNVIALGYCLHAFLAHLKSEGQLALMSSSAAYLPLPRAEAYGASKAAVNYLAQTLQVTLRHQRPNCHISLICPGFVKTPLTDKNDFPMPMRITAAKASQYIRQGLSKQQPEIHFPKRFTLWMKLFALFPTLLWQRLIALTLKTQ